TANALFRRGELQHVALAQRSSSKTSQAAQEMRRSASQKLFHLNAARDAQITTRPGTRQSNFKRPSRPHRMRNPHCKRLAIQSRAKIRPCQSDDSAFGEEVT